MTTIMYWGMHYYIQKHHQWCIDECVIVDVFYVIKPYKIPPPSLLYNIFAMQNTVGWPWSILNINLRSSSKWLWTYSCALITYIGSDWFSKQLLVRWSVTNSILWILICRDIFFSVSKFPKLKQQCMLLLGLQKALTLDKNPYSSMNVDFCC